VDQSLTTNNSVSTKKWCAFDTCGKTLRENICKQIKLTFCFPQSSHYKHTDQNSAPNQHNKSKTSINRSHATGGSMQKSNFWKFSNNNESTFRR